MDSCIQRLSTANLFYFRYEVPFLERVKCFFIHPVYVSHPHSSPTPTLTALNNNWVSHRCPMAPGHKNYWRHANWQLAYVVYMLSLYITVKVSRGFIIFTQKNHAAHVFLLVVDGQLVTKVLHFRENRNIILGTMGHILSRSS